MPLLVSCDFVTQACTVSSQEICLIISLTRSSCSGVKRNIFLVTYPKSVKVLACSGVGAGEGELATTSLKFEYLHRKSRCEMLIDEDDISTDVITFGTRFSIMFVYIRALFLFELIGKNLTAQSKKYNSNSRDVVASSPPFSCPATRAPLRT